MKCSTQTRQDGGGWGGGGEGGAEGPTESGWYVCTLMSKIRQKMANRKSISTQIHYITDTPKKLLEWKLEKKTPNKQHQKKKKPQQTNKQNPILSKKSIVFMDK